MSITKFEEWFRIEPARRRVNTVVRTCRTLFEMHESEVQVEKEVLADKLAELDADYPTEDQDENECLEYEMAEVSDELDFIAERISDVGEVCILYVDKELHAMLRDLLEYFGRATPKKALLGLKRQYLRRLGIDFHRAPMPWEDVLEIHLARNCIVHNNSRSNAEYQTLKRPKLLVEGRIVLDRRRFNQSLDVFSRFSTFVLSELRRKGRISE